MDQFEYNIIEILDLFSNLNDICPYYFPNGYIDTIYKLKNGSFKHFLHYTDKETIQLERYLINCINTILKKNYKIYCDVYNDEPLLII